MPVTLLASACPAPVAKGTVFYASDMYASGASLPTGYVFSTGMTTVTSAGLNKNTAFSELLGRYGGGQYGVGYGLDVTAGTGLLVNIAAGHAVIDWPIEKSAAFTVVVPDSSPRAWVWLKQDGTTTVQNNTTAKPAGNCVLLGSCVTSGGSVTSVDSSGVVYLQSGIPWRQTADTGGPSDTPDSTVRLYTKTLAGLFFWDGVLWRSVGNTYMKVTGAKSDANYTQTQTEQLVAHYNAAWTGWTGGHNLVVPLTDNWRQTVTNGTGQTMTVIGATGTGIAIASTKTAIVASDGTNVLRITADA